MVTQRDNNDFPPPEENSEQPTRNLFKIAWNHKGRLLLGAIVGLVLGTLFYSQRDPVYQTTTQILVVKKQSNPLPVTGGDHRLAEVEDYVATQIVLLRSQFLVEKAVDKRNLASLRSFANKGDPTGVIIGADRDPGQGHRQRERAQQHHQPESSEPGARRLWDHPQCPHRELPGFPRQQVSQYQRSNLAADREGAEQLEKSQAENRKKCDVFRQKSPLLIKGKVGINIYQERLAGIEERKSALQLRRTELRQRLKLLEEATKEGHGRAALLALMASSTKEASADSVVEEKLLPLMLQECQLLEDYGEDHPQVQAIRRKIALVRKTLTSQSAPGDEAGQQAAKEGEALMANPVARIRKP